MWLQVFLQTAATSSSRRETLLNNMNDWVNFCGSSTMQNIKLMTCNSCSCCYNFLENGLKLWGLFFLFFWMIGVNGECDVYMQLLPCFMTHPGEFKAQGGKFMGANLKVFSLLNKFQQLFFFFCLFNCEFFLFFFWFRGLLMLKYHHWKSCQ